MGQRPWLHIRLPGGLPRSCSGRIDSQRVWLGQQHGGGEASPGKWVSGLVEDLERKTNFGIIAVSPFEESSVDS